MTSSVMPARLHVYQCSFCKTIATSPVDVRAMLKCRLCMRLLAYKWSLPIETDEDRDLAARGIVFNPWAQPKAPFVYKPQCRRHGCWTRVDDATGVYLPGIGRFCSQDCADKGQIQYDEMMASLRALKADQPWLDIPALREEHTRG